MGGSIHVSAFSLADGRPAVALRFRFSTGLVALVKEVLRAWWSSPGRASAGWSARGRCWWVASKAWPVARQQLLNAGIDLWGPMAHPRRRRPRWLCFGVWQDGQEEVQEWDAAEGCWRWPKPRRRR
jgi:hypothetical protein